MHKFRSRQHNGTFQNLSETPQLAEGVSMLSVMKDFFFKRGVVSPPAALPALKTDLKAYYSEKPSVIWFGHSSYLVHCQGINILVDPVFSGHASPFRFYLRAFEGSDLYKPSDMPPIDVMIITHNHYDHLDKGSIRALAGNTRRFIMPLGVGRDLRKLPVIPDRIRELDWWDRDDPHPDIRITATPSRHFSGRGLRRNGSLWSSFVLEMKGHRIYIGSDSGYDEHFRVIGDAFGAFDLAILECGQYNAAWPYIHSMPEELIREGSELGAKVIMPVHWGKFALALHTWDEPVSRFVEAARQAGAEYTTPMIGEPVVIGEHYPKEAWWQNIAARPGR